MQSLENNDKSAYITVAQLAEYCAISKNTIYKLIDCGDLKCTRFGKSIRFSKAYIRKYLKEKSIENSEESNGGNNEE